jgi:hypothetical protein
VWCGPEEGSLLTLQSSALEVGVRVIDGVVAGFLELGGGLYFVRDRQAARQGEAQKVKELGRLLAQEVKNIFEKQTRRHVLSVQVHYDTGLASPEAEDKTAALAR